MESKPARDRETLELLLREVNAMRQSAFTKSPVTDTDRLLRRQHLATLEQVELHILKVLGAEWEDYFDFMEDPRSWDG